MCSFLSLTDNSVNFKEKYEETALGKYLLLLKKEAALGECLLLFVVIPILHRLE